MMLNADFMARFYLFLLKFFFKQLPEKCLECYCKTNKTFFIPSLGLLILNFVGSESF